jgi:hypothetical protein
MHITSSHGDFSMSQEMLNSNEVHSFKPAPSNDPAQTHVRRSENCSSKETQTRFRSVALMIAKMLTGNPEIMQQGTSEQDPKSEISLYTTNNPESLEASTHPRRTANPLRTIPYGESS